MADRKYSQLSLGELERLAKKHYDSFETLSAILDEVRFHTGSEAAKVQLALIRRVHELEPKNRGNRPKENSGDSKARDHSKKASTQDSEIETLRRQLSQAREQISNLQAQLKENVRSDEEKLFRRVGLNKDCPNFVISAVRVAYRKKLHPDLHPEIRKSEAHQRFIEAEKAFEEIYRLRNL